MIATTSLAGDSTYGFRQHVEVPVVFGLKFLVLRRIGNSFYHFASVINKFSVLKLISGPQCSDLVQSF